MVKLLFEMDVFISISSGVYYKNVEVEFGSYVFLLFVFVVVI